MEPTPIYPQEAVPQNPIVMPKPPRQHHGAFWALVVVLVAAGVVYFMFFVPKSAQAPSPSPEASTSKKVSVQLLAASTTHKVGQTFSILVLVDIRGTSAITPNLSVTFPSASLQVVSSASGAYRTSGIGTVATLTVKALKAGPAIIAVDVFGMKSAITLTITQ